MGLLRPLCLEAIRSIQIRAMVANGDSAYAAVRCGCLGKVSLVFV